jgi:hypothetical protein
VVGQGDRHRAHRRGGGGELGRHKFVGRSEIFVITVELAIAGVFVVLGLTRSDPGRFVDNGGHSWLGVLFAAGLLYVTYEEFGVVANSAGDMRDPARERWARWRASRSSSSTARSASAIFVCTTRRARSRGSCCWR